MASRTKGYELKADVFHETTSKPGEPFTFKTHHKGDTIQLDAEQAERLIAADAVVDPDASDGEKPGGATKRPKGKATEGAEPAGTGSTTTSEDGGKGQGNAGGTTTAAGATGGSVPVTGDSATGDSGSGSSSS